MYDHILVALDGSEPSRYAGRNAMTLAAALGARITVCHVYGSDIHRRRFIEMEPGLPTKYQDEEILSNLRGSHKKLMEEGFRALSIGYVEDFVSSCHDAGIETESIAVQGRSYVGILHLARTRRADLIILGADGLGAVGDGMLGGTTTRVLDAACCDVLVVRRAFEAGSVLVGVDGSQEALKATEYAASVTRAMDKPLHIVAAYDPVFHTHVFGVMAKSLSSQRRDEVGLVDQEKLHDEIINEGLSKLYKKFLKEVEHHLGDCDVPLKSSLTTGKAYCALNSVANDCGADLIVIGRHGHHRQSCSRLGSTAEALIRTTSANVLLVGSVEENSSRPKQMCAIKEIDAGTRDVVWDSDAEERLQRVPSFVRNMARRTVENRIRELGKNCVNVRDFEAVAARFGMGSQKSTESHPEENT